MFGLECVFRFFYYDGFSAFDPCPHPLPSDRDGSRKVFAQMDKNGDGKIHSAEFAFWRRFFFGWGRGGYE